MAPAKRQMWVDIYDPETGHYNCQPVVKDQSPGQASGVNLPNKVQEETADYSVKHPQENAHKTPGFSGANDSTSDEPTTTNWTRRPNDSATSKVKAQPIAKVERSLRKPGGLSQSRWAPKKDANEVKSDQQFTAPTSLDESQRNSNAIAKKYDNSSKTIDSGVVHEARKALATTTLVDAVERDSRRHDHMDTQTNTGCNVVPKDHKRVETVEDEFSPTEQFSYLPKDAKKYVKNWVQSTHEITVDLHPEGVTNPEQCDIDPETGRLMEPVISASEVHRMAKENPVEPEDNTKPIEEDALPEELKPKREYRSEDDVPRQRLEVPLVYPEHASNPREIRVPCHLRPARRDDMMQVAALYNEEMDASYKTPDKRPVGHHKWFGVYDGCRTENMPFFVAVDGWYNTAAENNGPVIAFAVMDVAVRGIFGSYKTYAAPCGKLTVVVHPDYRRQNVCSALLDAVFSCCSTYYTSREGYEFVNKDKDRRYMTPENNVRQWSYIDIEVVVPSGSSKREVEQDERFKWVATYLSKYFDMSVVYHDEKLFKDDRYKNLWLDRITFRHQCRPRGS
ncbi:hypothetical protein F5Y00DRAFT_270870 [Daldinia vernicosa]|uniref:uncharacterized protein n=1 Tax=Daldinia vernicosa TaxID=114800 RepID=UPI0020077855|nr:uncharacterized protein F5Y00DRAFT_270870 [Daldinia vernicosa]KAI0847956.1 hypothetical protein F5Y00DRAFT_270870 [Daldinia vernicosa]